jgi:ABC-2 type transport system ATP-binding protein
MSTKEETVAINVQHVSKYFLLPHEKTTSIKSGFVNVFKKKDRSTETQKALKDISFQVKKGEFFGILGRNGSGKSTLLKILAEIYQPTNGSVQVNGKLVPFIELGVGFNPELTGRENVYLNGALLGFSKKEIDERYEDIVAFAELEDFMDQKLKNYSSGMQVRLAFSVATRSDAEILLVDEVLAVGDADFQRKCYDYFKSLKKTGKTVVFVTHDMGAVREYCDRAILVNKGLISVDGSADEVADEYLKLFIKESEANGELDRNEDPARWGSKDITFEKVKHTFTKESLHFEFLIKNNTEKAFEDSVDLGIDFYIDDQLITGTHYLFYDQKGFSLKPNEKKTIVVEFPNTLTDYTYDININIKADGNNNVCDEWKKAITFTNMYRHDYSKFFKVVFAPTRFEELKK